jgi:DNA-nicking Smr family endonuclease
VKKPDTPTEADDDFARAMAGVTAIPPDPRGRVRISPDMTAMVPASTPTVHPGPSEAADGRDAAYAAPGVDRREIRKLKRGDYIPSQRLDLHGRTSAEALADLQTFLARAASRHRVVCIVHGRGLNSPGGVPVLSARVRGYLKEHPSVLAFADAPRTDGGLGAVYVLLRK